MAERAGAGLVSAKACVGDGADMRDVRAESHSGLGLLSQGGWCRAGHPPSPDQGLQVHSFQSGYCMRPPRADSPAWHSLAASAAPPGGHISDMSHMDGCHVSMSPVQDGKVFAVSHPPCTAGEVTSGRQPSEAPVEPSLLFPFLFLHHHPQAHSYLRHPR